MTTTNRPHGNETLKNVSIFVSYEAIDPMIDMATPELVASLIQVIGTSLVVKSLKTHSTSSNPTVYGDFSYKVGKTSYELTARYDEDQSLWKLIF